MTREERCWEDLCKRLQRDPATSEESDTCSLRVAFKHALAFTGAEAAAMRERAAGVAKAYADEVKGLSAEENAAEQIEALIRALPTTEK